MNGGCEVGVFCLVNVGRVCGKGFFLLWFYLFTVCHNEVSGHSSTLHLPDRRKPKEEEEKNYNEK